MSAITLPFYVAQFTNEQGEHFIIGPLVGCGPYGSVPFPEMQSKTVAEAQQKAALLNKGYVAGVLHARQAMRQALGIEQ